MATAPAHLPENGEKIHLPHTWNGKDGQDGGNDYFRGTCCYAKVIKKSELPQGEAYYLEINGANSTADVYMNGKRLPDVVSYNHYFGRYGGSHEEYGPWFDKFHEKYPNTPISISKYGCEALNCHNSDPEAGDYSEEYQAVYHESLIRQLFTRP